MRDHVRLCLQNLTGHRSEFSDELEAFWRDVETKYKACNVMQIPQNHIPFWHERSIDKGLPLVNGFKSIVEPPELKRAVRQLAFV